MPTAPSSLPTRWPASVTPSQALGYLLARHVPLHRLPQGLTLIREAAGWLPPEGLKSPQLGMHQATVRSWVYASRNHARVLGPPPGLAELLAVLDDGAIRTLAKARSLLTAAGADDLADPRVLSDFAGWCGLDPPFEVLAGGPAGSDQPGVCLGAVDDLRRARRIVEALLRRYGLISAGRALQHLVAEGIQVDAGNDAKTLRDLLGTAGHSAWLWPSREITTPLRTAMERIHSTGEPVPLDQLPAAVARAAKRRWPKVAGEWPLPFDAVRDWVDARPEWRRTGLDRIEPVGPQPPMHAHDQAIRSVLGAEPMPWTALHAALIEGGMTGPTAGAAITSSPLLRRVRAGYVRLGTASPLAG